MFQKIKVYMTKSYYTLTYYILLLRNNLQANNISELCNRCYDQTNSTTFTEIRKVATEGRQNSITRQCHRIP